MGFECRQLFQFRIGLQAPVSETRPHVVRVIAHESRIEHPFIVYRTGGRIPRRHRF